MTWGAGVGLGLALAWFAAAPVRAGVAVVHVYPGVAPCDATLQACIAAAAPGDVVELSGVSVAETVTIEKSLTLRRAAGTTASFAAGHHIVLVNPAGESHVMEVSDLTLVAGVIQAIQVSELPFHVVIRDVLVADASGNHAIALYKDSVTDASGLFTFELADNRVEVPVARPFSSPGISIANSVGPMAGVVEQNTVRNYFSEPERGGIEVYNALGELEIDVFGNAVVGPGFRQGVSIRLDGGIVHARVAGNLVADQPDLPTSVVAFEAVASDGSLDLSFVNNTAADGLRGLLVGGRADLGAVITGEIVNNVIALMSGPAITIDEGFRTGIDVPDDRNLVYGGPVSSGQALRVLEVDPQFQEGYTIAPGSPAVDAGDSTRVPPELTEDVDGLERIAGAAVDLGAHEVPQHSPGRCSPLPVRSCRVSNRASLGINERRAGYEKLRARFGDVAPPPVADDLGDPLSETSHYTFCLYEEQRLVAELDVLGGTRRCGRRGDPCWRERGRKGWRYRDPYAAQDGVFKLRASHGRRAQLQLRAQNHPAKDQFSLATGLAAALQGGEQIEMQLQAGHGACFLASLHDVQEADGARFRARGGGRPGPAP